MRNKQEEKILACVKCGHILNGELKTPSEYDNSIGKTVSNYSSSEESLKIMDSEKPIEALPTTNIDCPKCANNSAFWWMLQTRSADEATTQFYRCTQCNHTWRNYS
jgi:DNA-directed RNA polymerase subunit M